MRVESKFKFVLFVLFGQFPLSNRSPRYSLVSCCGPRACRRRPFVCRFRSRLRFRCCCRLFLWCVCRRRSSLYSLVESTSIVSLLKSLSSIVCLKMFSCGWLTSSLLKVSSLTSWSTCCNSNWWFLVFCCSTMSLQVVVCSRLSSLFVVMSCTREFETSFVCD